MRAVVLLLLATSLSACHFFNSQPDNGPAEAAIEQNRSGEDALPSVSNDIPTTIEESDTSAGEYNVRLNHQHLHHVSLTPHVGCFHQAQDELPSDLDLSVSDYINLDNSRYAQLEALPIEELASIQHRDETQPQSKTDEQHASPSIWPRIRKGFQLDLELNNKRIQVQLDWYARNQKYLDRTFKRASLYMHHIVEEIEKRNMPMELALLPVVESAFDPFAYSHGRASGLWQFIPGTGRIYGLHQNWWYDGRRDVLASTQAAINYMDFLQGRFDGNWLHALASYNTGSGRVNKSIRKNKKRGKKTDFWSLKLPRETRAYVPKLLAISKLVAAPERYGVTLPYIADEKVFDTITIDSQLDLAQAAGMAGIDINELYRFNPGFNQWATAPDGPHRLLIPTENAEIFKTNLAQLPKDQRLTWNRYSVRPGDSLIKIAKKFHTTPKLIKQVNRLTSDRIRVKQKLLIPIASKGKKYYDLSAANRLASKQKRFKAPSGSAKMTYTVKPGDTLWELSLKHKVGLRTLAKWNGMAPTDVLKPGKQLLIYSKAEGTDLATEIPSLTNDRNMIRRVGYRVRRGDSLARIASKFGVTVKDLVSWNKIDRKKYLQPGQKLTIYVDITRG